MRVAYLGGYDAAGQRFNGVILHRALRAAGHASDYIVAEQSLQEPGIGQLGPHWLQRLNRQAVKLEAKLSRQSDLAVHYTVTHLHAISSFGGCSLVHLVI